MNLSRRRALQFLACFLASGKPIAGSGSTIPAIRNAKQVASGEVELWKKFSSALTSKSLCSIDYDRFKICSGLAVADWEYINYTGLPPTSTPGSKIAENIYAWADSMPDYASAYYLPGNSLFNQYSTFINSLKVSPRDEASIETVRNKLKQAEMKDIAGNIWPAYRISPGLNDFVQASLQSVIQPKAKQIRFSLMLPAECAANSFLPCNLSTPGSNRAIPFLGIDQSIDGAAMSAQLPPENCPSLREKNPNSEKNTSQTGYPRIDFEAQSMQMFTVSAAAWFDAGILSGFYDQIDPTSALANKVLFGPDGLINIRTSQILVASGRKVTIHLAPPDLDKCKNIATAGRSLLNVGGFCFDSEQTEVFSRDGTLILKDNTNAPYVVGVISDILGSASGRAADKLRTPKVTSSS